MTIQPIFLLGAAVLQAMPLVAQAAAPDTARALKTLIGPDAAGQAQSLNAPPAAGSPAVAQPPIPSMAPTGNLPAMPPPAAPIPSGQSGVVMVKPGDTLAKILDRSMGRPFDRRAVVQTMVTLNPHAFVKGNPNRLIANVPLRVPSQQEMAGLLTGQLTPAAVVAQMSGGGAAQSGSAEGRAHSNMTVDPHRGWPRYPSR